MSDSSGLASYVFLSLQFEGENAALSNMNTYLVQAFEQFK